MILKELYNPHHKLVKLPLLVKSIYLLPAFVLVLCSSSLMFDGLVLAVFLVLTFFVCKLSVSHLFKLYRIPLMFILLGCLTIAISLESTRPFFKIYSISLGFDMSNVEVAKLVLLRSLAMVSVVFFGLLTHTISELAVAMRYCKIPTLFIELFILTYNFIFSLSHTAKSLHIAQKCRLAYSTQGNKLPAFGLLIYATFRKALYQSSQVEIALMARLGTGDFVFVSPEKSFAKRQLLSPILLSCLLLLLYLKIKQYE